MACRCGDVTVWAVLIAERGRVYATCRDCGAQVAGTDPDAPNAIAADEVEVETIPYKLIAGSLRKRIVDGDLAPGHLLRTVKELAATYSVSVGTARRAIALLTEEGWLPYDAVPARQSESDHLQAACSDAAIRPCPLSGHPVLGLITSPGRRSRSAP